MNLNIRSAVRATLGVVLFTIAFALPPTLERSGEAHAQGNSACWYNARNGCTNRKQKACLDECGAAADCETALCREQRHSCRNRCYSRAQRCDYRITCGDEATRACGVRVVERPGNVCDE